MFQNLFEKKDPLFTNEFRILKKQKKFPNFTDNTSQKLNREFENEIYIMWTDFENFEDALELNQRRIIKDYGKGWKLVLNYNSEDFIRDANYSLSLVYKEKEVAIMSFFPKKGKIIEIVQIQGEKGYEEQLKFLPGDWKALLIEEAKIYLQFLNFNRLEILRGEKNYLMKFPRNVGPEFDMQEHKKRMLYIYNVLPVRKWNFKYDQKNNPFVSYYNL
jgi:hypothetical protein